MTNITETIAGALCAAQGYEPSENEMARTMDEAAAAIAAIEAAGYCIVPVEPTEAMISAGIIERHDQPTPEAWNLATANIYRAMIETGRTKA